MAHLSTLYRREARQQELKRRGWRRCLVCGEETIRPDARSDKETCGDACRKRRERGDLLWTACETCGRIGVPPSWKSQTCAECEEQKDWVELACEVGWCPWVFYGPHTEAHRAAYIHRSRHTWGFIG